MKLNIRIAIAPLSEIREQWMSCQLSATVHMPILTLLQLRSLWGLRMPSRSYTPFVSMTVTVTV